jgi:hypothetical protein
MTFSVLCQICDSLSCDIATVTKGIPHLLVARPNSPFEGFLVVNKSGKPPACGFQTAYRQGSGRRR